MQPGPASKHHIRFPDEWEGTWQDRDGKILEISCLGKMQMVTFRPGLHHPPFPLPNHPGSATEDLPARFFMGQENCYCLEVTIGEPEVGPFVQLFFYSPEGDRMRVAELKDPSDHISVSPKIFSFDGEEDTSLSWVHPLLFFRKIS